MGGLALPDDAIWKLRKQTNRPPCCRRLWHLNGGCAGAVRDTRSSAGEPFQEMMFRQVGCMRTARLPSHLLEQSVQATLDGRDVKLVVGSADIARRKLAAKGTG